MPFVLDASVTVCWAFPDEQHPVADRAATLLQTPGEIAIVPPLWWYEVRNALLVSERRGRTTQDRTGIFLDDLSNLSIHVSAGPESNALLDLARSHQLSAYDAAYLSLAIRERHPLATIDRKLVAAAHALKVPILT